MKTSLMRTSIFFVLLSAWSFIAQGSIDVYEFQDEATREQFVSLTKELRCPKCQNQDIADSNAPIAADMRKEVHRLLQEGRDRESIIDHMIERFGDFVTYKPRLTAETFMLWYGPWIIVLLGLLIIATMIRKKMPAPPKATKPTPAVKDVSKGGVGNAYSSEVKKLLDKYDDKNADN